MALNEISKIATQLLLREPFYGHFLLGIPKELNTEIKTACVSLLGKSIIKLKVNPSFWQSLSESHRYGLIKHEILHLVMRHLFMQANYSNKKLFNIACDLVVNQYIAEDQLPDGAILISTFDDLKVQYGLELEPLKSTDYYYRMLQPFTQQTVKYSKIGILKDLLEGDNDHMDKHAEWGEFEAIDSATEKIMDYQLYNQVKSVVDRLKSSQVGMGHLPMQLVVYLENYLKSYVAKVDWKRELRKFATSSNSTYIKNTLRRPSKRYGTTPGIKIKRRNRLLVVLDTSGSVPVSDIETFFGELHQIWKLGAEVILTECDATINNVYTYKGVMPENIQGRGGTSFDPPIVLANQRIKPDGIIYFTDGYAHPPKVKSRYSILWIITSTGINEENNMESTWQRLPGKKVKMHE